VVGVGWRGRWDCRRGRGGGIETDICRVCGGFGVGSLQSESCSSFEFQTRLSVRAICDRLFRQELLPAHFSSPFVQK